MPPDLYHPSFEQGKYLAFLGRLSPDKGPVDAVEMARKAGLPLRIAAKLPRQQYEAMACGTPAIAYPCGSVPEVIEHGVAGFIVENQDEAAKAVRDVGLLDRRRIREIFEQRFTCNRMARSYLDHYRALVHGTSQRPDAAISAIGTPLQEEAAVTDPRGRRLLPRVD